MKIRTLLFVTALLVSGGALKAQFSLSGEFRPRAEYRHGFKTLSQNDQDAAFQISQRSRLNAQYKMDQWQAGISIQDVRLWGETPQLVASSTRMMLHQAWFSYNFATNWSVKLGRQELVYDDARIFGNVDWAQQARTHDVALFRFEGSFKLHAGLAYNQQSDLLFTTNYDLAGNYKSMQFLWFNKKWEHISVSALFLNNGLERKYTDANQDVYETMFSQTGGLHLTWKNNKLSTYGSYYMTAGKDVADRTLNAYNAKAGMTYALAAALKVSVGFETLSGTSEKSKAEDPANYVNKSFNPFYGTNHKFNGFMDYFFVGNHLNSVGLNDIHVQISYSKHKSQVSIGLHQFGSAADVLVSGSTTELMDRRLGTEIDLTFSYKLHETATFSCGYSQMFGTSTLQQLKGGDHTSTNNWAWMMLAFKPKFL